MLWQILNVLRQTPIKISNVVTISIISAVINRLKMLHKSTDFTYCTIFLVDLNLLIVFYSMKKQNNFVISSLLMFVWTCRALHFTEFFYDNIHYVTAVFILANIHEVNQKMILASSTTINKISAWAIEQLNLLFELNIEELQPGRDL